MGQVSRMHRKGKEICVEKMREFRLLADTVGDLFGSYSIPFAGSAKSIPPQPHPYYVSSL